MTVLDMGLGPVNGHLVSIALKEAVQRAMEEARKRRSDFVEFAKPGYDAKRAEEVFTDVDRDTQDIYVRMIGECFPDAGIIGEEQEPGANIPLLIPPKNGCRAYFTLDPIDGTRAYIRRQSHGVSTMVALVLDGAVIAAYIGDINSKETYGYRPGSNHVWRIIDRRNINELLPPSPKSASEMYVMLRDPPGTYGLAARRLIKRFKNNEVMGSSIGTWMARLWKQEVGAMLLPAGVETPWDSTPIIGISQRLGYVFMRPVPRHPNGWEVYEPDLPTRLTKRKHDTLIVHEHSAHQFKVKQFANQE